MIQFVILLSITVLAQGIQVKYWDCGNHQSDAIFKSIVLLNCHQQPCVLNSEKDLEFEIQLQLEETVSHFDVQFSAVTYNYGNQLTVSTNTLQPLNCHNNRCKLRAGDKRCIHPTLRFRERVPSTSMDIYTDIYDQSGRIIGCAVFPLQVRDY